MYVFVGAVAVVFLGIAYIRLVPAEAARWHVPIRATADADMPGGAIRVAEVDSAALARVDAAMQALPRTRVLAGSVAAGRVTYETRSRVVGFPDYTTIEHSDGVLKMHARLRFGRSDLGVNRDRLERLLVVAKG